MKNILLINPPLYFSNGVPHFLDATVPPLGLLYIASYVNNYSNDFKTEIIDLGVERANLNEIEERIVVNSPFVIGIYSMTPQLQGTLELANFIKNGISKEITIFLGGPHISADTGFIDRHSGLFDYAIKGEGEKTFLDSINKLTKADKIPKIQESEIIMDLDSIPFPNKKLIKREKYKKAESMIFSRGCPYKCYYCSRPSVSGKVRYRSVRNLINEIKLNYKYCDGYINFQDDTFTMNKKRVMEFCEAVKIERLNLHWECSTRIDLVDDELLAEMKMAGCELIHFGIESGNEQLRINQIHKGNFTNAQIKQVFSWCRKYAIKIACYFMIGHPGETKETLEETNKMILESGIDLVGVSIPTPFPGSELYDISERIGIISKDIIDAFAKKKLGEGYVGNFPIYIPDGIEREYLFDLMKDINRKFYINFGTFWKRFKKDIISPKDFKKDAIDFMSLLISGVSSRKPYKNKNKNLKKVKDYFHKIPFKYC